MYRHLFPVFAIVLLISTCLFSGCLITSDKGEVTSLNSSPVINGGLAQVEREPLPQSFSLDEVRRSMQPGEMHPFSPFSNTTQILFIQGVNLDGGGNAERWIFDVDNAGVNEMIVYDRSGWTIIPLTREIYAEEIALERVISPEALFNQNSLRTLSGSLSTIPVRRDIELKNGTYKITILSNGLSSVLKFNATTGAAME
jgi:hypothetical protein